jgi:hypothetical protein
LPLHQPAAADIKAFHRRVRCHSLTPNICLLAFNYPQTQQYKESSIDLKKYTSSELDCQEPAAGIIITATR